MTEWSCNGGQFSEVGIHRNGCHVELILVKAHEGLVLLKSENHVKKGSQGNSKKVVKVCVTRICILIGISDENESISCFQLNGIVSKVLYAKRHKYGT